MLSNYEKKCRVSVPIFFQALHVKKVIQFGSEILQKEKIDFLKSIIFEFIIGIGIKNYYLLGTYMKKDKTK